MSRSKLCNKKYHNNRAGNESMALWFALGIGVVCISVVLLGVIK